MAGRAGVGPRTDSSSPSGLSGELTWRDAEKSDRPALEQFTCTGPAPKGPNHRPLPHPRPWEQEAQTGIRTRKPPGATRDIYRVGTTADGTIVAVAVAGTLDEPSYTNTYKLMVLAVATSVRGAGGEVADACMRDVLGQIGHRARADGLAAVLVLSQVDPHNEPSRSMCQRHEFTSAGVRGDYEVWIRHIAIEPLRA